MLETFTAQREKGTFQPSALVCEEFRACFSDPDSPCNPSANTTNIYTLGCVDIISDSCRDKLTKDESESVSTVFLRAFRGQLNREERCKYLQGDLSTPRASINAKCTADDVDMFDKFVNNYLWIHKCTNCESSNTGCLSMIDAK